MRTSLRALMPVLALLLLSSTAIAAPGDLDMSFADGGAAITKFADRYGVAVSVGVQADGRIVVAGTMRQNLASQSDFALARYTANGHLDDTFGGDGRVLTDFGGRSDEAFGLALQPDGKAVVVGRTLDDLAVTRYRMDGSLDPTFSRNGRLVLDIDGPDTAYGVAVQSNGKIVVVGRAGQDFAVLRLHPGGKRDRTFGLRGLVRTDFAGSFDVARAVEIDAAGRIVVGGSAMVEAAQRGDFALARYDRHGTLDGSFGTGGLVTTDFLSFEDGITGLVALPSGGVVASGHAEEEPGWADQAADVALARYDAHGSLVYGFGDGDGTVRTDFGSYFDDAFGMAVQADGRIIVGSHHLDGSINTAAVARYAPNGRLDASFSDDGIAVSDVAVSGDNVGGLALQPDGKIVLAGAATTDDPGSSFAFFVARFLAG